MLLCRLVSVEMSKILEIKPFRSTVDADVIIPGSKSITNRVLVAAVLAQGQSTLSGVLDADDTRAMLGVARSLGAEITQDVPGSDTYKIVGTGGDLKPGPVSVHVDMSGTTARFATPLAARGQGLYHIDAAAQMRARPMDVTVSALRELGVTVSCDTGANNEPVLPLSVHAGDYRGGRVTLAADASSQFASGLLLSAPGLVNGLELELAGDVVSQPYIDMTVEVMRSFGAEIEVSEEPQHCYRVSPKSYEARNYHIEPDASAASYFFALAAVMGGRVKVAGLGRSSLQGDIGFVRILEKMGAEVTMTDTSTEVRSDGNLRGVDVDMSDISDTAQTLAAIAPFAKGTTRVRGIGFIRAKETDRIAAVVNELRSLGVNATDDGDGFTIEPGPVSAGVVKTYSDHRMAMSFSLLALKAEGVSILDPDCVAKTFPTYWQVLEASLCR